MVAEAAHGSDFITEYVPPQGANADGGSHTHIDADHDHFCDICGERLSACVDNNKDHFCDYCGWIVEGEAGQCVDNNKDHKCDYEGCTFDNNFGVHADEDGDHRCDYCGEVMTSHKDDNGDGFCDICGEKMHTCIDENPKDHFCDICDEPMGGEAGDHEDKDKDHKCDYCGGTGFGVHADEDGDGLCDYCGEPIIAVTLSIASADDPDTIIETIKTTYGAIVELTPIFPSMVITTDSDEVILSAEYNKDTNAVIAELRDAIGEGGGGKDDYTPQKGVDYWTEEDKAEIKAYVDDAILGGAW